MKIYYCVGKTYCRIFKLWDWVEIVRVLHLSYFLTVHWSVNWAVVNESTDHGTDFMMVQLILFLSVSSTWCKKKKTKKKHFPWSLLHVQCMIVQKMTSTSDENFALKPLTKFWTFWYHFCGNIICHGNLLSIF